MEQIKQALENITTNVTELAIPLAILGVLIVIIAFLVSPLLPDGVSSAAKGYVQKALLAVALITFIPGIIKGLGAIGGAPGGGDEQLLVPLLLLLPRPSQVLAQIDLRRSDCAIRDSSSISRGGSTTQP